MLPSKSDQNINEFCKRGNLEKYRAVITNIFQKIENSGCRISARYDADVSLHEVFNGKCIIRISLQDIYKDQVQILWTIFHEFGHHVIGAIDKKDENNFEKRILCERKAWDFAKERS